MDKRSYEAGIEQALLDASIVEPTKEAGIGSYVEPALARLKALMSSAKEPATKALTLGGRIPLTAGAAGAGAAGLGGMHALMGDDALGTSLGAGLGGMAGGAYGLRHDPAMLQKLLSSVPR